MSNPASGLVNLNFQGIGYLNEYCEAWLLVYYDICISYHDDISESYFKELMNAIFQSKFNVFAGVQYSYISLQDWTYLEMGINDVDDLYTYCNNAFIDFSYSTYKNIRDGYLDGTYIEGVLLLDGNSYQKNVCY